MGLATVLIYWLWKGAHEIMHIKQSMSKGGHVQWLVSSIVQYPIVLKDKRRLIPKASGDSSQL